MCQWSSGPPRRLAARPTSALTALASAGSHRSPPSPNGSTRCRSAPCGRAATSTSEDEPSCTPISTARRRPAAMRCSSADSAAEWVVRGGTRPVRSASWRSPRLRRRRSGALARRPRAAPRQPIRSSTGSSFARSAVQSGAPITPSSLHELDVPGVDDGGRQDPRVAGARDVHRAVVHQHVDAELHAARDLVEGAVQVVVGHPDLLEPALGGRSASRAPVARHVDPVAAARASARTVSTASG